LTPQVVHTEKSLSAAGTYCRDGGRHLSSGQGHETSFTQLLGEWLAVRPDCLRLVTDDTDRVAIGAGSHSGRSLRLASMTAHQASGEIIERGRRFASHRLEAAEADIDFADGHFTVAGTDRSLDRPVCGRGGGAG
jgi:carbon-monoxide dehydrogenase large subunit